MRKTQARPARLRGRPPLLGAQAIPAQAIGGARGVQVCGLTQHAELAGAPGYDCIVGGVQGGQGKGQVSQGETFEMAKLAVLGEQARSAGLGER